MSAVIEKAYYPRMGFYLIHNSLKENIFFSRYSDATAFCRGKGWDYSKI